MLVLAFVRGTRRAVDMPTEQGFPHYETPADDGSRALRYAARMGRADVVRLLLADERVDPAAFRQAALKAAVAGGSVDVVNLLWEDERVDVRGHERELLMEASSGGHVHIVRMLLSDTRGDWTSARHAALARAAAMGRTAVVRMLLEDTALRPAPGYHGPLLQAIRHNRVNVVRLLLQDGRADPASDRQAALRCACDGGNPKMVKLLLDDPRVDPAKASGLLTRAFQRNYVEAVALVVADGRFGRLLDYHWDPVLMCISFGRLDILNVLLQHDVHAAKVTKDAMYAAARKCPAIFARLLQHPVANDVVPGDGTLLEHAITCPNSLAVLLKDARVNPHVFGRNACALAVQARQPRSLALLLADGRVDPAGNNNEALMVAVRQKSLRCLRLLLRDARVDPTARDYLAMLKAYLSDAAVMRVLLCHPAVKPDPHTLHVLCLSRHARLRALSALAAARRGVSALLGFGGIGRVSWPKRLVSTRATVLAAMLQARRVGRFRGEGAVKPASALELVEPYGRAILGWL